MADCYGQLGYGSYVSPEDAFPRARAAAKKALELDPTLAEAHASLGYATMYHDWNFTEAEKEFKRAIELNPNYAVAHQWYAYLLTAVERPLADADREIAIAKSLDPLSVPILSDRAYIFYYYGKNDEALRSVKSALEMNPKFPMGYFWLARIYTSQGRYNDAESALRSIGPLRTWTPAMATIGYLYAKESRPQEARDVLAEFDELMRQGRYASGTLLRSSMPAYPTRSARFLTWKRHIASARTGSSGSSAILDGTASVRMHAFRTLFGG